MAWSRRRACSELSGTWRPGRRHRTTASTCASCSPSAWERVEHHRGCVSSEICEDAAARRDRAALGECRTQFGEARRRWYRRLTLVRGERHRLTTPLRNLRPGTISASKNPASHRRGGALQRERAARPGILVLARVTCEALVVALGRGPHALAVVGAGELRRTPCGRAPRPSRRPSRRASPSAGAVRASSTPCPPRPRRSRRRADHPRTVDDAP